MTGALDIDDLDALVELADGWEAPPIGPATKARLALAALRATGPVRPPHAPPSELAPKGRFHSIARDSRAVRHHYDLPPEFFRLFLGPSMTYSCAIFSRGATTLEEAQEAKHELICRKLELKRGQHVLDVGCGWGSFAIHAAQRHGVHVTGITLSPPQTETARRRAAEAGVGDRTDFRVVDYRELAGASFDAVASIGMVEHVGGERMDEYAQRLRGALRPGAPLLNHGIANLRQADPKPGAFSSRYVFPDGAPQPLSRVLVALERAQLQIHHIEEFREDYAETLRQWARLLDENQEEAVRLAGAERVRVWRLYLRAARNGFETGFTSVYQVRAS